MIPAYNQAEILGTAIESALSQDYPHLEVVVSDDCSTDETKTVLKKFEADTRLRYYRNTQNSGRVANYKKMLEQYVNGDWVVNLDGDDYFTDLSFISKAIQLIYKSDPGSIVFLQAGHTIKTPEGKIVRQDIPDIESSYVEIDGREYFLNFNHFSHLATIFNRHKAVALDFYRYDILSTDIESFLRLALQGTVILMKESVGVWLHHGYNLSKKLNIVVVEKNMLRIEGPYVYAKSLGIFPENALLKWKIRLTNDYLQNYLSISIKKGKEMKGYFIHVVRYYPQVIFSLVIPRAIFRAFVS
jgi:glycosyltransferase involved in cell wall biosynthesis